MDRAKAEREGRQPGWGPGQEALDPFRALSHLGLVIVPGKNARKGRCQRSHFAGGDVVAPRIPYEDRGIRALSSVSGPVCLPGAWPARGMPLIQDQDNQAVQSPPGGGLQGD